MSELTLGMAIEIVVAVLLVLTIFYCMALNRRIIRLRADEAVLRATIAELITATEIAERAILGLKATAGDCERSLGDRLSQTEGMLQDLDRQLVAGGELMRRLTAIVEAGASVPKAPVARAPVPVASEGSEKALGIKSLQSAALAATERLAAYRRQSREEAA
jgi:Domain of unknown function (DUF6468)